MNTVELAINKIGSQGKLARALGLKQQTIFGWKERAQVPAEHVLSVERITGVPCWELRPDIYPPAMFKRNGG